MKNETLVNILHGLNEIESTIGSGSQQLKSNIIKQLHNIYGDDLLLVLSVAFDPFIQTHYKKFEDVEKVSSFEFDEIVSEITTVKSLNNVLRNDVNCFIAQFKRTPVHQTLIKVLTKSLNIGIGVKAINKTLGYKFINDVVVMKAEDDIKIVEQWLNNKKRVFGEVKYDGIRCFATIKNRKVQNALTYNLSELDTTKMTNIVAQLEALSQYTELDDFFFDFEITGFDRRSVSGQVNSLIQEKAPIGCDAKWLANIFDIVPSSVFEKPCPLTYEYRSHGLIIMFEKYCESKTDPKGNVRVAQSWLIKSMEELNQLFAKMLERGEEGLVVKLGEGVYELKRSKFWVKMKAVRECDLEIVGWYPGEKGTKRENTIGGFTCKSSDGLLLVDVGGGYSDELLEEIVANDPNSYTGRIVEVLFNEVIGKKDSDLKSLFLPRLSKKGFRATWDKNVANSLSEILKK